jgi:hypothetical protein
MEFPNLADFLLQGSGIIILKIPILILLFIYALFQFIVINRIRAFNRIVHIAAAHASVTLQIFAVVQFFLALSLFFLALVIV